MTEGNRRQKIFTRGVKGAILVTVVKGRIALGSTVFPGTPAILFFLLEWITRLQVLLSLSGNASPSCILYPSIWGTPCDYFWPWILKISQNAYFIIWIWSPYLDGVLGGPGLWSRLPLLITYQSVLLINVILLLAPFGCNVWGGPTVTACHREEKKSDT